MDVSAWTFRPMLSQPRANVSNLQQEKKSNFYSDGFWLSKYSLIYFNIKKCNLILCNVSSQNEGCPKPWKLSLDLKVSGPLLFLRRAEHLVIFLFPEPARKKNQRIKLLKHSWNSKSRTPTKTFKFKTRCHVNWFTNISLRPINLQ